MTRLVRRWPVRAVILIMAAALLSLPAPMRANARAADDDIKWSVVPSSKTGPNGRRTFDYELAPREKLTDWVGISNLTARPITLNLYATDAFNVLDGGFGLLEAAQLPKDVGTWIALPRKEITIPAKKRLDIPFTLTVPPGAEPGDHIGGIIGSATEYMVTAQGQRVKVDRRIAARVYLRVAGPIRPAVEVTRVDVDYHGSALPVGRTMTVTYRVANHGNVRLGGVARVQVTGPLGVRVAGSKVITIPELLPDSEIELHETLGSVFPAGHLTASASVNAHTDKASLPQAKKSTSVWAMPWVLVGVLVLLLAALVFRIIVRRIRRRRAALVNAAADSDLAVTPA